MIKWWRFIYTYIKKHPGFIRVSSGSIGSRVDRVLPGQILGWFFHQPGLVPTPDQPGPGSTRRAGPGFKTMLAAENPPHEVISSRWKEEEEDLIHVKITKKTHRNYNRLIGKDPIPLLYNAVIHKIPYS